ncbi:jerky protein homolog-like [Pseudomyrmex gracilis]|uniref:jerky protein homolog-like n=1 Tax=Pseudomyrmex gracilis TaxID=219809 RepID=UPI000994F067|nr:jerky protein homolog-like [Pseudomyrmex gracilis]
MPNSGKDPTVKERSEIVKKLQDGASVNTLANNYGLSKRSIRNYRKNAVRIQQLAKNETLKKRKRIRTSNVEEINTRLSTWILEKRMLGDILTDNLIQQKALELHQKFGVPAKFTASRGWLWRFKKRHNSGLIHIHGEQADANKTVTEQFIEELARKIEQENIDENNIYNMDESGLLWKNLPQKTLTRTSEERVDGNRVKKDRVSIGFCANSTGTHKLPLLFVHKYACPRALKHVKNNLPVVYKNQKNAWIDEEIFNNWYINHFQPTVRQRQLQDNSMGKVLLLVDNFKGHNVRDGENDHFELMFLPPNKTSILQPMNQGLITKCKTSFRYNLLQKVVECPRGIRQFYFNYDIKDCIDLIHDAWKSVSQTNICNAWRKLLKRQNTEIKEEQIENYSFDEVNNWVSHCEEAELIRENDKETEEPTLRQNCEIAEDELKDLFDQLSLWAETQPEFIQFYIKVLIDYYYKK